MTSVETPRTFLGGLDSAATAALVAAAADVSLILDAEGIVRDVTFGSPEMAQEGYKKWIDQPWIETVTADSRPKVEALIRDAGVNGAHKWRHINHTSARGADVPVLYSAVQVGPAGQIVAFGRDLRAMANLQQRLVDAQQSMERDYWRLRNVETRYRMLFQMSSEAILIVDATTEKVIEANPTAGDLLGESIKRVVGRSLAECFGVESAQVVQTLVAGVRAVGRADDVSIRLGPDRRELLVSAFYFRQENGALYLLRISVPRSEAGTSTVPKAVLRAVEHAGDAFVVTDLDSRVIASNRAFVDLAQMPAESQVRGEPLDRWIGRSGVDFSVLMANLRQHGTIRLFASTLTGEHGSTAEVEISAVSIPAGDPPCMGFNIRNVGRRVTAEPAAGGELPRSVEQLTELVGRVPLKELVREATDLIEKLCIEAALQLTQDNRASAAEVLGLSRQSLYVKLRRYGLGDLSPEIEEPPA
ncbi:MAG: transcriptional regulator PpsR [Panacagrimonas sp.]